jgi:Zn-dependent M28 family amino/carboxypeptidase
VERRFATFGYRTRVDRFPLPQGGRSANVEAWWGTDPPTTIIGGHLDTVAGAPGANDNASGVAVILELARDLAGTRLATGLRLVVFGAEERQPDGEHHLGSQHLAASFGPGRLRRIRAMISVDMIGKDAPVIVGWTAGAAQRTADLLLQAATGLGIPAGFRILGDVSDHVPFSRAGVPSAVLWTGPEPNYHTPTDVVSNVDVPALATTGKVLLALLRNRLRR